MKSFSRIKPGFVAAVIWAALWVASLLLPVAIMGPAKDNVSPGWAILMMGWMGLFVLQFGWFANLAFLSAQSLLASCTRRTAWATVTSAALLVLTADALAWHEMYGDSGTAPIKAFGAGYYVWLFVMVGTAITVA